MLPVEDSAGHQEGEARHDAGHEHGLGRPEAVVVAPLAAGALAHARAPPTTAPPAHTCRRTRVREVTFNMQEAVNTNFWKRLANREIFWLILLHYNSCRLSLSLSNIHPNLGISTLMQASKLACKQTYKLQDRLTHKKLEKKTDILKHTFTDGIPLV